MNFDANTLSMLMQLMGSQKPRENEVPYHANDNTANHYRNAPSGQNQSQSVFAMQNGLGQRVDLEPKPEKQSQSTSNPMSAIFDMMSGKGGGTGTDMMSNLFPMFMNMMSKPAQVASGAPKNEAKPNQNFEQKLKAAMDNANGNGGNSNNQGNVDNRPSDIKRSDAPVESDFDKRRKEAQNRQSNGAKSHINYDKYSPISFAGYPLICSLNKLYTAKYMS